jgi:serine/threonine protein kinase
VAQTLITDRRTSGSTYTVLRKLGKGGMAEVFLARQEGLAGLQRLTVIKKLLPQYVDVQDVEGMLVDEARVAAQLTHPNIVQIFELGQEDGQYFIAMEFVDGPDLATLARIERHRQSRIPLRLTLRVISEAAMGLDYAHRLVGLDGRPLSIVHRDVSPHNVLCSREGGVKVTDFGISKFTGKAQLTQVGVVKGKVQYMSPEQYRGAAVDHRSDIFSLGVVLYQLTVGRLPRVTDSGQVAVKRVLEGNIPRPTQVRPDYPEQLETIVMRALNQNPAERQPDAASLRDELLDYARENDLLAFPKELADYVNTEVPPSPLVVREQSMFSAGPLPPPQPLVEPRVEERHLPSVIVEGQDASTGAPPSTEVAGEADSEPPQEEIATAPAAGTEIPIDLEDDPAVLDNETLTPLPGEQPSRGGTRAAAAGTEPLDMALPEPTHATPSATEPLVLDPPRPGLPPAPPAPGPDPAPAPEPAAAPAPEPAAAPAPEPDTDTDPAPAPAPGQASRRGPGRSLWLALGLGVLVAGGVVGYLVARQPAAPPPLPPRPAPVIGAGVINVLANPNQATVSVDGAQRCPSTPCQIAGLPLGREMLLTLRARGYSVWMQRLVLTRSENRLLLRADLTPLPARQGQPPAAAGARAAAARVDAGADARPGTAARPRRPSRPAVPRGVTVVKVGGDRVLLAVDVRPWAEVHLNGKKLGHTPMQVPLPPGRYTVLLKNEQMKFAKTFKFSAARGRKYKITLSIPAAGQ